MHVSFEDNIRMLAETASNVQRTFENVVRGARRTKNKVDELTGSQFPNESLEHVIWLERCRPSERVLKVCSVFIILNWVIVPPVTM